MDFAKSLLLKYGWQEGQGIGKNADGIVKPIKANLKFDNAGFSFDKSSEFNDHWWEKAFNNAAENLTVDSASENVLISVKNNETTEVCTMENPKCEAYAGYFLKSDVKSEDVPENIQFQEGFDNIWTDESVLRACSGRTAHKGARHGLSLSGKLNRIEAQEKQLLQENLLNSETATNIFKSWVQVKSKRKNRGQDEKSPIELLNGTISNYNSKCSSSSPESDKLSYRIKCTSRKKRRQQRDRDEDLAGLMSRLSANDENTSSQSVKIHAIQSASKRIKKENKRTKKKYNMRKNVVIGENQNINDVSEGSSGFKSKSSQWKKSRIRSKAIELFSSDSGEEDRLGQQIAIIMKKYPSKKFKVIAEELTPFQKKHLQKSGLRVKLKSKNRDRKKWLKERAQMEHISKKIQQSINFNC